MGSYEKTMLKLEKMAASNTAAGQTWQKEMSDTAHQREVKDLVAAGLNPVLSSGGSGAQSYTTTVDSAVNAIGNMAASKEAASATRYAARQSAAATKAMAAAQMYAADVSAHATKWATAHSKSGTLAGVISNLIKDAKWFSSAQYQNLNDATKKIEKNPNKYFSNGESANSYSDLNWKGKFMVKNLAYKAGINSPTQSQLNDVFLAVFKNDKSAIAKYAAWSAKHWKTINSSVNEYNRYHLDTYHSHH